jgi:hypothetical protein
MNKEYIIFFVENGKISSWYFFQYRN